MGGRWSGLLKLLPGRSGFTARPLESDPVIAAAFNRPPLATREPRSGHCDQARKGDVDWVGMRTDSGGEAGSFWNQVRSWTAGAEWRSLKEVCDQFADDREGRKHYAAQSAIQAVQQTLQPEQRWSRVDDVWSGTREDSVAAAWAAAVTHAALVDGQWLDADDFEADWGQRLHAILDTVPDHTLITIVDCHA